MFVVQEFPKDKTIDKYLSQKSKQDLMHYEHSGKLLALYDKLVECEVIMKVGADATSKEESKMGSSEFDT
jgi:hypothetical protein